MNSWSISKIQCYEACPRKYKAKYIQKMREKPGPAAQRGTEIHARAESYLEGRIRGMPNELMKLKDQFKSLKKSKPLTELKLAVDDSWNSTDWKKGWCRGIVDAMTRIDEETIIIDHKTGKIYQKHEEQAEVYACLAASNVPDIEDIHVEFWYLDKGYIEAWDYDSSDIAEMKESWGERVQKMLTAKRFPETPGDFTCRYCPANSKRGGPCQGWRRI